MLDQQLMTNNSTLETLIASQLKGSTTMPIELSTSLNSTSDHLSINQHRNILYLPPTYLKSSFSPQSHKIPPAPKK